MESSTFCHYYDEKECHSCKWIEIPREEQHRQKEQRLRNALPFYPNLNLLPLIASSPTGFRNKAKMAVTGTTENPIIGLLGEAKMDEGRALLSCPIHHPKLNEVIEDLPNWIRDYQLIPYQIETRKGELKGLILFYSEDSGQMHLRFVLRSKECVSRIRKLLPALQQKFPMLVCVSANLQPIPHAVLEGPEEIYITEQNFIEHTLGPVTLKLSPQAFVQTNAKLATRLYQAAAEWIQTIHPATMLELFCGQGPFSFFAAKSATKIVGLEINPDAVKTANETAQKLGLSHLQFLAVDAAAARETYQALHPDLVLVNPPRRGIGTEGVTLILEEMPKHVIYSSCSAESLGRDLEGLSAHYTLEKAQIFDLFPHTEHFETLVYLSRRSRIAEA